MTVSRRRSQRPVRALPPEGDAHLDEPQRHGAEARALLVAQRLQVVLLDLLRLVRHERLVLAGRDVAHVAEHPHDLVVAEQDVHSPARAPRPVFQLAEEVEHLPRIRPAVNDVPQLHEVRAAAGPAAAGVDDAGGAQYLDVAVVGAVNVADGDDPLDVLVLARTGLLRLDCRRRRERCEKDGGEGAEDDSLKTSPAGAEGGHGVGAPGQYGTQVRTFIVTPPRPRRKKPAARPGLRFTWTRSPGARGCVPGPRARSLTGSRRRSPLRSVRSWSGRGRAADRRARPSAS